MARFPDDAASKLDSMITLTGLRTICLSSRELTVAVIPEAGGRIYSIYHRTLGRELLWQNPEIPPARVSARTSYDDNWCGGWDDVLPNDEPASVLGLSLPDHGEAWSAEFEVLEEEPARVRLGASLRAAQLSIEKELRLAGEGLEVRYALHNHGERDLPYMWKLHPAIRIAPGDRIYIPARRFQLEPRSAGTLAGARMSGVWPLAQAQDRTVDLSMVPPPEARELFFVYALDLREGSCGVYRAADRSLCVWRFPKELFTACMMFATYGGWRGHYAAVLEPTTAWPFRLEQAVEAGTCSWLAAGARVEAKVQFQVLRDAEYPEP